MLPPDPAAGAHPLQRVGDDLGERATDRLHSSTQRNGVPPSRAARRSVAAREDEGPHREQYRLEPQDRSVHHADRIDHV